MDTDESMKAVSRNSFAILLPIKGAFELRLTNPSRALVLTISLTHLLSLVLESRDTQWIMSQLVEIDARLKKWQWCESMKVAKSYLQSARLDAIISLFVKSGHRNGQQEAILKLLLQCIRLTVTEGGFRSSQYSVQRVR